MATRPAALKGLWYPKSAADCEDFLKASPRTAAASPQAVGAIVPHAGWRYSGAIAFDALAALAEAKPAPDLVIVFGGHLNAMHEPRLLLEGDFETPFGNATIAEALAKDVAMAMPCDLETPDAFYDDNAIEVLMPMVHRLWPDAAVLTIGLPPTEESMTMGADIIKLAQQHGYKDIAIVGSTDLTHYGPNYNFVAHGRGFEGMDWVKTKNDAEMIASLEKMDPKAVLFQAQRHRNACCSGAVAAALTGARILGARQGSTLRYQTSWDVCPDDETPASFVGYTGMVLNRV